MQNIEENTRLQTDDFSLSRYIRRLAKHKWLFIITFFFALLLAAVYYYWKTPLYRIQSALVIKDEKKGESISLTLKELDFLDEQKIIDNEAEIIRSESIVSRVVASMHLNIAYSRRENLLRRVPLYDETPIVFSLFKSSPALYQEPLEIDLSQGKNYRLEGSKESFEFGTVVKWKGAEFAVTRVGSVRANPGVIQVAISDPDETTQQLKSVINASAPSKNSSVLYVTMLHPSRERGAAILTEIIREYERANVADKRNQTDSIVARIETRLALIGQQVRELEGKEQKLKTNQGITFLSEDARSYLDQAKATDKDYTDAQIQLDNIDKIGEYLTNNSSVTSPPNTSLNDPVLTNMISTLNQLEVQKQTLLKKSGPQHPSILAVDKQLENLKKSLADNVQLQRSSLEKKISLLKQTQGKINSSISRVPTSERNLLELMREKSIRENIYSYLLEKREEASLSDAAVFSKMRLVDTPFSTTKPVKPKPILIFGAALLFAIVVPVGMIGLKETFRSRISTSKLKSSVPYPIIGYVPRLKKFNYQVFTESNNIVNEQFRAMRILLQKSERTHHSDNIKTILVTSPQAGDGKSFVAVNLAANYAQSGKKTVLVDFDLRKSKMSTVFEITGNDELYQQLSSGEINVDRLAQRTGSIENLYLIANQTAVENASDVFDNADLNFFFGSLAQNFECIVINTPPFNYFSDAYKLETYADITLMVLRDGYTSLQQVSKITESADERKMKHPYIVYNGIARKELFERKQLKGYKAYQYS